MITLTDRVAQVDHLKNWASEILTWCGDDGGTAEEMVAFELENTEIELPEWFDDHDRGLLVRFIDDERAINVELADLASAHFDRLGGAL